MPTKCNIPSLSLPPCEREWGHESDMHRNAGDYFYALAYDKEHHRRQRARKKKASKPLVLTKVEEKAIAALEELAKKWPKTLSLFSWSGTLHVMKKGGGRTYSQASATTIKIPTEEGDPDAYEEMP
jgi:hypothetical protein